MQYDAAQLLVKIKLVFRVVGLRFSYSHATINLMVAYSPSGEIPVAAVADVAEMAAAVATASAAVAAVAPALCGFPWDPFRR